MSLSTGLPSNLLLLVLFVVPGLISIRAYQYVAKRVDQYSRIEAIVYSLCLSIVSILTLYGLVSVEVGDLLTIPDLRHLSDTELLPRSIHGYLALNSVGTLLGLYAGVVRRYMLDPDVTFREYWKALDKAAYEVDMEDLNDAYTEILGGGPMETRGELWDYTFKYIYSQSTVTIHKTDGDDIEGEILLAGDTIQNRDLLISPGTRDDLEGDNGPQETYRYIPPDDISHISFNEDINKDDSDVAKREMDDEPEDPHPLSEDVAEEVEKEIEENGNEPEAEPADEPAEIDEMGSKSYESS